MLRRPRAGEMYSADIVSMHVMLAMQLAGESGAMQLPKAAWDERSS